MRKKIFSVLKFTLFLGIGVFLIWWQISKMTEVQKIQFVESLKNARYIYLIPIILMAILSHWSRAVRWKLMLEPMGYHPSTANTFYATLTGYFGNNFVPRAGEIMRCTMLSKYEKVPFTKALGTVITERLFDFISYLVVIMITFLIQIQTVRNFITEKAEAIVPQESSLAPWLVALLILAIAIIFFFISKGLYKRYAQIGIIKKTTTTIAGLKEGVFTIMHLKKRKAFLLHTLFIWSMYLLQVYVGFNALQITSHLGIGAAFSVLSLSTLAMIISPGGIGAFPVAVQQVLLIYHVDNISFGWLIWGANTGIIIILGILSFTLLHFNNKNEKDRQHTGPHNRRSGNTKAGESLALK